MRQIQPRSALLAQCCLCLSLVSAALESSAPTTQWVSWGLIQHRDKVNLLRAHVSVVAIGLAQSGDPEICVEWMELNLVDTEMLPQAGGW